MALLGALESETRRRYVEENAEFVESLRARGKRFQIVHFNNAAIIVRITGTQGGDRGRDDVTCYHDPRLSTRWPAEFDGKLARSRECSRIPRFTEMVY